MTSDYLLHQHFMDQALTLAKTASIHHEVPVGAVVVSDGSVIGRGHNRVIADSDPSAHAEIVAIRDAATNVGNYRLNGCSLYVTMEPCVMCAGAILHARIDDVIFGVRDERFGAAGTQLNLLESPFFNHQCKVHSGVLGDEAKDLLQSFFLSRRGRVSQGEEGT